MKFFGMKMRLITPLMVMCCLISVGGQVAQAQTYTSDPNLADFTAHISSYATFTNFTSGGQSSPFTPTSAELAASGFRVYGGTFTSPGLPVGTLPNN